jgi:hypothetical protein
MYLGRVGLYVVWRNGGASIVWISGSCVSYTEYGSFCEGFLWMRTAEIEVYRVDLFDEIRLLFDYFFIVSP